jgi:hypothetical protein
VSKSHHAVNIGRWRFAFWRGPTKLGVHRSLPGCGSAGLGLFGMNWVHRDR